MNPLQDKAVAFTDFAPHARPDPARSVLVKRAYKKLNDKNQNYLAFHAGGPGSGKSYDFISYAESIDPHFTPEKIVFTPRQFMDVIVNDRLLKKGSAIIWDEFGVGMSSRDWYSISNKSINAVLQTFRINNIAFLATAPSFSYVDSASRLLFNHFFETVGLPSNNHTVLTKPFEIQVNQRQTHRAYFKYPTVRFGGRSYKLERAVFGLPTVELMEAYEALHKPYKRGIQKDVRESIIGAEERASFAKMPPDEIFKAIEANLEGYGKKTLDGKWIIDETSIEYKFGVGGRISRRLKKALERKLNPAPQPLKP